MSTPRVVELECCQECPNFDYGPRTCGEMDDKVVPNSKVDIPDWCPLCTPQEYAENNFNIDEA